MSSSPPLPTPSPGGTLPPSALSALVSLAQQVRHPKQRAELLAAIDARLAVIDGAADEERLLDELASGRALTPAFAFLESTTPDNPELSPVVRYRAAHGGRGSGKSHNFATALLIRARQRKTRVLCTREVQKTIKESVKKLLDKKIKQLGLGSFFRSTESGIVGENGSEFIFMGLRGSGGAAGGAQGVKSTEDIDIAWVEEAQTVSKASLKLLDPTVRNPGSEVWFTWNPRNATDPVDEMFRGPGGPPPGSIVREVNWDQNPYFPEVLRLQKDYALRRDKDDYAHIWGGGYESNSEARVFKNWRVEAFDVPAGVTFLQGADWGYSIDPNVLVRCFVEGNNLFICDEAYAVGVEIDDVPKLFAGKAGAKPEELETWSELDDERWPGIPGAKEVLTIGDSENPQTISYLRRQNFRIQPAVKGPGSIEEGIRFLKLYDIVVHPRCIHTIDELSRFSWKRDKLTDLVTNELSEKDNHVIDSLRYAVEPIRNFSGGEGLFQWMRDQAAAVAAERQAGPQVVGRPTLAIAPPAAAAVDARVCLRPPMGIQVAYGASGTAYSPDRDGLFWIPMGDARAFFNLTGWEHVQGG